MLPRLLFVTGKLAETALRRTLAELAPRAGFDYERGRAADHRGRAGHDALDRPPSATYRTASSASSCPACAPATWPRCRRSRPLPVERGPKDLRDLPEFFRARPPPPITALTTSPFSPKSTTPRVCRCDELLAQARALRAAGADVIDVGCDPGDAWAGVGDAVPALRDEGMRVSIDSFHPSRWRRRCRPAPSWC